MPPLSSQSVWFILCLVVKLHLVSLFFCSRRTFVLFCLLLTFTLVSAVCIPGRQKRCHKGSRLFETRRSPPVTEARRISSTETLSIDDPVAMGDIMFSG